MIAFIIISVCLFVATLLFLLFLYKYLRLRKEIINFKNIGTGRYGVYVEKGYLCSAYVFIKEIDRYTNGYSKIKLNRIEKISSSFDKSDYESIKNKFISLKKTSDIEWLENEDHLKKLRKEKIEKLQKI